jgi:hypothetical protein
MRRTVFENQEGSLKMTKQHPTHFVQQKMTEKRYFASGSLVRGDNPTLWVALADICRNVAQPIRNTITSLNRNTNECLDQSHGSPLAAIFEQKQRFAGRIETFQKQILNQAR